MACRCLGVAAGCSGRKNYSSVVWRWKREQMTRMSAAGLKGASSRSSFAIRCSSISEGSDRDSKKLRSDDMLTLSTKISTDVPLYEPHGVYFRYTNLCIKDRPRIFKAMFPDKGQQLNDEEWRLQMQPISVLFMSVIPVVDIHLICKSYGKDYPSSVPLHVTRILELQITRWELKGLEGVSVPSQFYLNVEGVLYSVRKGSRSRLKWDLEIDISLVLPPALALVPKDVIKAVFASVLTRVVEKMKQEVDAGLLSDFSNFQREKIAKHGQSTPLPMATTDILNGDSSTNPLVKPQSKEKQ